MKERLVLRTALGKHAHVKPLRDGRVTSDRIAFDFVDMDPLPKAFRLMVRGGALDLSEMAVVTHLMAHHYGKPIVGLAIPLWSRLPHTNLVCPSDSDLRVPKDLEGRKVGVRAYAQTSGVWVRGVLQSEYGVDLDRITWGTMEDSHLAEYEDPPGCVRYTSPPPLRERMLQGEFAAIMGEREVDPAGIRSVIPDAEAAALAWIAKSGLFPINHGLTVRQELIGAHPWLAQELMDLFSAARTVAVDADGAEAPPAYGFSENQASLQLLLDFSGQQKITPRRYGAEELFLPV